MPVSVLFREPEDTVCVKNKYYSSNFKNRTLYLLFSAYDTAQHITVRTFAAILQFCTPTAVCWLNLSLTCMWMCGLLGIPSFGNSLSLSLSLSLSIVMSVMLGYNWSVVCGRFGEVWEWGTESWYSFKSLCHLWAIRVSPGLWKEFPNRLCAPRQLITLPFNWLIKFNPPTTLFPADVWGLWVCWRKMANVYLLKKAELHCKTPPCNFSVRHDLLLYCLSGLCYGFSCLKITFFSWLSSRTNFIVAWQ